MLNGLNRRHFLLIPAIAVVIGLLVSALVAWTGSVWLQSFFVGTLLSLIIAFLLLRNLRQRAESLELLETPFYLAHDAEVFDRYRQVSQLLLRISNRSNVVYRELALQRLDEIIEQISLLGSGKLIFSETETWRLAYGKVLRDPTVFFYRSVALVRDPAYWQDAAGRGSIQFNYELIDQQIVTIERIVIIADELWPRNEDLPVEELRQWIHEQLVHGVWIQLVRASDLEQEPELLQDIGIYGQRAIGVQELAADNLSTRRFTLDFDANAVREAKKRWNKLGVYAVSYKDLLDRFRLVE